MSDTNVVSQKQVWSPSELADALGVTVQHVRRLIRNGTIAHFPHRRDRPKDFHPPG